MPIPTTLENKKAVVIICRDSYWRPLSSGYTSSLFEAGVYEPFEPWRKEDKLLSVFKAMDEAGFSYADKMCISARAESDLRKYEQKQIEPVE